jgi:NADH:ubiquinone oxidoreductase subunit F (NADH-binding)/(2Fe-2S) ferredoxin
MKINSVEDLNRLKETGLASLYPQKTKVLVGMGTCGLASGAKEVFETLQQKIREKGLDIVLSQTGCIGFCQKEPIVDVIIPGMPRVSYGSISPERVPELVEQIAQRKLKKDWLLARMDEDYCLIDETRHLYCPDNIPQDWQEILRYQDLPFYKKQLKIALRNCGYIDPEKIEEYIARGGYFTLYKVLHHLTPEEVIEKITQSGLRGRGGAGFPTGIKWRFTREAPGDIKYLICNGDEGDPGAYMDRSLLEGDPHSALEGMLIGAYAIGATQGYFYVRTEYPLAIHNLKVALKQAQKYGLLGENIFGSSFCFDINLVRGAGAFICGEETALIASIEGAIGEPRPRPPFPAQKGLWGQPTNINNVETWANIPVIIARGPNWYAQLGTEKSKGTKVFSLVGKINNTGLIELPMGITLGEVIYEIGEGIPQGKRFKAIQTGGPSGGCIPMTMIDLPIDYEGLTEAGSIMGSGGLVVMDEDTCMVDVAKYFLKFTADESCGLCTPCREGIKQMLQLLTQISQGEGKEEDIELLEELAQAVKDASLCGLGGTAPNPVLSTIRYFLEEYQAHIRDKKCPAKVCRSLICYLIDPDSCTQCGLCIDSCPEGAITGEAGEVPQINSDKCVKCAICFETCPAEAIIVQ